MTLEQKASELFPFSEDYISGEVKSIGNSLQEVRRQDFIDGGKWVMEEAWMSVEDGLPEKYKRVLVFNDRWGDSAKPDIGSRGWLFGWGMWPKPTHWQPLPQPPTK